MVVQKLSNPAMSFLFGRLRLSHRHGVEISVRGASTLLKAIHLYPCSHLAVSQQSSNFIVTSFHIKNGGKDETGILDLIFPRCPMCERLSDRT